MRILLIDDSWTDRYLLKDSFQKQAINPVIWEFESGEGAFVFVERVEKGEQDVPDVIILDLHLPGWSGREILSRIRAIEKLSSIPVVISSGEDRLERQEILRQFPHTHFLPKPRTIEETGQMVEAITKLIASP